MKGPFDSHLYRVRARHGQVGGVTSWLRRPSMKLGLGILANCTGVGNLLMLMLRASTVLKYGTVSFTIRHI